VALTVNKTDLPEHADCEIGCVAMVGSVFTARVAALEVTVPALLVTTTVYDPAWVAAAEATE